MKKELIKHHFKLIETGIWTKNNWTIRLDKYFIEVFNNVDKSIGKYYINSIDKVDIDLLLDEIDELDK